MTKPAPANLKFLELPFDDSSLSLTANIKGYQRTGHGVPDIVLSDVKISRDGKKAIHEIPEVIMSLSMEWYVLIQKHSGSDLCLDIKLSEQYHGAAQGKNIYDPAAVGGAKLKHSPTGSVWTI